MFSRMYRTADDVASLPWHRERPPTLLGHAVAQRAKPGRALDLGCGEGVYTTYLAQQGYSVVGVDFVPEALDAARDRLNQAGLHAELHQCDVIDFSTPEPFDIVLDSGCLHHLARSQPAVYRSGLDNWLAPGGDFVLVHFAHRPKVRWLPKGPAHLTKEEAVELFAPFELREYDEVSFEVPFPMGHMRAGVYWFSRQH